MTNDASDGGGAGGRPDQEPGVTYRPSLVKLTIDVRAMREEVLVGFPSRSDVLRWEQRLTVRTLGEVPMHFYDELGRQFRFEELPAGRSREPVVRFRSPEREQLLQAALLGKAVPPESRRRRGRRERRERRQGALLAALLQDAARDRPIDERVATELRERLVATYVSPAYHRAFRQLRKNAGEYIEKTDEDAGHDPSSQKHIAMRPALDELDHYQSRALGDVVDGLDDRAAILDWIEDVELATHGEVPPGFVERCYKEPSAVELLTSGPERRGGRELFAAYHLIPAFNRGVRDLVGRAGELPDAEQERSQPKAV